MRTRYDRFALCCQLTGGIVEHFGVVAIVLICYLLPSFIAFMRGHSSRWGIAIFNVLLGWTVLGWIAALIWSVSNKGTQTVVIQNITQK